ncbi:MAG TPA: methyltransferase [Prolixibacteraceae bacterium]|nr:methyltransferase [Prolixibacteraceae bacterium]
MNFDEQAQVWDKDPKKIERVKVVAKEIINFIQPYQKLSAFEFGCGTGLLSFELKDSFNRITLADNSEEMIKVLKEKIKAAGIKNFDPLIIDLNEEDITISMQDVVYTLMALHYMPDIDKTLKAFNSTIKQNGYLCIADLVKEDGSYHAHENDFNAQNGFDRKELTEILLINNLKVVFYNVCYVIEIEVNNEAKKYPLFLMIGKKSSN